MIGELFIIDGNQYQSIIDNLTRLLNTRLGMSYVNYGLKSIEDYKRVLIHSDTLINDISTCIQLYERRLCELSINELPCLSQLEFRRYHLTANYLNNTFSAVIIIQSNGHIMLKMDDVSCS